MTLNHFIINVKHHLVTLGCDKLEIQVTLHDFDNQKQIVSAWENGKYAVEVVEELMEYVDAIRENMFYDRQ